MEVKKWTIIDSESIKRRITGLLIDKKMEKLPAKYVIMDRKGMMDEEVF
ncbi:MAG: hypothetical protein PUB10_03665 [Clostridiales bacterium]|nr:hypothetical protein [Clostridiales bacterium]